MLMRLSRPSRSVTLSRVSQSSIPAEFPSAGASTGRGLDGRCHTVATDTRTQAGVVVCREDHGVHDRPLRDRHGQREHDEELSK